MGISWFHGDYNFNDVVFLDNEILSEILMKNLEISVVTMDEIYCVVGFQLLAFLRFQGNGNRHVEDMISHHMEIVLRFLEEIIQPWESQFITISGGGNPQFSREFINPRVAIKINTRDIYQMILKLEIHFEPYWWCTRWLITSINCRYIYLPEDSSDR